MGYLQRAIVSCYLHQWATARTAVQRQQASPANCDDARPACSSEARPGRPDPPSSRLFAPAVSPRSLCGRRALSCSLAAPALTQTWRFGPLWCAQQYSHRHQSSSSHGSLLAGLLQRRRVDEVVPPSLATARARRSEEHADLSSPAPATSDAGAGPQTLPPPPAEPPPPGPVAAHGDADDAYVPLLFRRSFLEEWAGQHCRWAPWATETEALDPVEDEVDVATARALAAQEPGACPIAVSRATAARHLILDPVQWLAESPDAPLMDPDALLAAIVPTARELSFSGSTAGVRETEEDPKGAADAAEQQAVLAARTETSDAAGEVASRSSVPPCPVSHAEDDTQLSVRAADGTAAASRLIYNVFTHRVVKESSASVQALSLLGIHVNDGTRELEVRDADAMHAFAHKLRTHKVTWPSFWSRSVLYRQLERFLSDERVQDPAERAAELLAAQYAKRRSRRRVGVVTSGDDGQSPLTSDAAADSAALSSPLLTADERLFSLADLNDEQQKVVQLVMQGHHVYIGGPAGTGKSVLLRVIKQEMHREGLTVAVTGTTGVASTLIGGSTLHHCFGINIHGEFTRRKELAAYDAIIIDEVSMLPRELFEALERQLRRANAVDLPFGGVQIILCGDFMQLGAISSQPIVNAPLFRRHFVMLKLFSVVRQAASPRFAEQLRMLRRGQVAPDLQDTVSLHPSSATATASAAAESALMERQQQQLLAITGESSATSETVVAPAETPAATDRTYVEGAVNLLPTNAEVFLANERELAKLAGDVVVFASQVLAPALAGSWSATYLLRVTDTAALQTRRLSMEVELFLGRFFQRTQEGQSWLLGTLDQRHMVLYPLFVDALALRVRLPADFTDDIARAFATYMEKELDPFLQSLGLGVCVSDVLPVGDGLQTEQDDYVLSQYTQLAPVAQPLTLKLGARVMLRANLAPGLVNGSIGTVVGFRRLAVDELPRYLVGTQQKAEAVQSYVDFLTFEQGFAAPMAPEVDFGGGRVEVIPPSVFTVGGLPNTHHYSVGIVALPLTLAYAFTVHKVQGLTLVGRVHLELSRMWPCEHLLYVAMSRVRNPEQLSISHFDAGLVRAAADCLVYDDALPRVEDACVRSHFVPATWRRAPHRRKREIRRRELDKLVSQKRARQRERQAARRRQLDTEVKALEASFLAGGGAGGSTPV